MLPWHLQVCLEYKVLPWHLQVCLEYLERYYVLIAFTSYLFDPAFSPDATQQISFGRWMRRRPELQRCG